MPGKILIVEDHQDSREILKVQLEVIGFEVIEARDGEESLEKAQAARPDLIIMDLGLPKIDGIEATSKLKQNPKTKNIPVIAYTAWSKEQYYEKARSAGIAEYLTKPTPPQVLQSVIEKILPKKS